MATVPSILQPSPSIGQRAHRQPLALWHLLSLDAPTVAVVWTWFIARACALRLPVASLAAMGLAVWVVYAADRLLDARVLDDRPLDQTEGLEPRHLFHHRHRGRFLAGIVASCIGLTPLLLRIPLPALRLYLIEAVFLIAWFLVIHLARGAHRLPKEWAVGPFFAAGTFIPTVSRIPAERELLLGPAILLAALCGLNCLCIYAWENPNALAEERAHASTRFGLRRLSVLPIAVAVAGLALAAIERGIWPLPVAAALSSIGLLVLDRRHRALSPTNLRAAADWMLLSPLLLVPFLPR